MRRAYAAAAAIVFTAALFAFFRFSLTGKAIRACADNHIGALVVGLNVKRLYALTFGIGAACVGAAGVHDDLITDATPVLGPAYTLLAFVIVIIGGLGSMAGALVGGVLIGVTEALAGLLFTPSAKSMFSLRHPGAGAAVAAAGHLGQEDGMIARLARWRDACDRWRFSPRLLAVLLIVPLAGQRLSAHGPDPRALSRLYRPGLEHHDGLRRPAVARQRPLCRARRLCGGGAVHPLSASGRGSGFWRRSGRGGMRRDHRLSRLSLRRVAASISPC